MARAAGALWPGPANVGPGCFCAPGGLFGGWAGDCVVSFRHFRYHMIVKTRDTMRQEEMAAHLIAEIDSILKADKIPSILQCYEVLAFSDHDGMIDYLDGFLSLHEIKKTINELGFDSLGVW